jgi:hypothetical protein
MFRASFVIIFLSLFSFCSRKQNTDTVSSIHFTSLPSSKTNIDFSNTIVENDSVNLAVNEYAYTGSGVGIGDFNNDGLPDIFLGANQQSSHLYLNKGGFQFEDITEKAGLHTSNWVTGVSVADVNNDGYDDIYLCISGTKNPNQRKNLLFINNKDLTFSEQAEAYGLNDSLYSTQAVFLDYDKDGDLDMYLVNHLIFDPQTNDVAPPNRTGKAPARDKLFRNMGIRKGTDHPYFEDVSAAAGIIDDGFGLGVVVNDFNNDNWPDIYVSNDYIANDILWLNNHDGTFSNSIGRSMKHQSYSSMGVDAGDINNDGKSDVISLDMLPEDNERKKMMYSFLNYDRYVLEREAGFQPELMRNMLQLNNGLRSINDTVVPFFSEIGEFAGISQTDWSWSVLLADFDNDGKKDIHITNGMGRDMTNNDFISFMGTSIRSQSGAGLVKALTQKLNEIGTVELNNYCFHNSGGLRFANVTKEAGLNELSISTGCAYADLDNDGDLDLVVNNINKKAFLLQNDARSLTTQDSTHNYITVTLVGDSLNRNGFGAKMTVYADSTIQLLEQNPVKGFFSTVDKRLHAGVGNTTLIDSIRVVWPDDLQQILYRVKPNQVLTVKHSDARREPLHFTPATEMIFTDVTAEKNISFKHQETFFYDYGYQQLLPQKYSQLGPFTTQGDINGDGLTDFFVGGATHQSGRFFIQQANGSFVSKDLVTGEKLQEDLGCLLFDADGDKDLDLFINSGSNEYPPGSANYLPRLYKNDGLGNFTLDKQALPATIFTSSQCVAGADYDGDGDIDLFIGGRIYPNQYPASPESYLLRNDGGKFSIITPDVCPALQSAGMITSAVWTDLDNDHKPDLVVAGEWTAIRFFHNDGTKLTEITGATGLTDMEGQWRSLTVADLDHDGDMDIVAGNFGLNNKYGASAEHPIRLFAKDLDANGSLDPVIAYYIKDKEGKKELFPAIGRDQFASQVPGVKKKYLYHKDYSSVNIEKLFTAKDKEDMIELTCKETRSVWLENKGNGKFAMHVLPDEAQYAPVNSIICADIDKDGKTDILIAGNEYQEEISTGRYDASYGLLMKGDGKGKFKVIPPVESGLIIDGDVKDMQLLVTGDKERIILTAINDEKIKAYRLR